MYFSNIAMVILFFLYSSPYRCHSFNFTIAVVVTLNIFACFCDWFVQCFVFVLHIYLSIFLALKAITKRKTSRCRYYEQGRDTTIAIAMNNFAFWLDRYYFRRLYVYCILYIIIISYIIASKKVKTIRHCFMRKV